jgi:hypothetical protein
VSSPLVSDCIRRIFQALDDAFFLGESANFDSISFEEKSRTRADWEESCVTAWWNDAAATLSFTSPPPPFTISASPFPFIVGFEFKKRSQLFIRSHNETLAVAAMRVCNPERSPV